ncbi:MAG: PP2C family protein-serine/threonine phosphatase, partial [Bacteroidia bacterium]
TNKDENARAINELSAQYDYKEQTQKIELLTRDKAIQDQRIENDRNLKIIYASIAVFLMLLSGLFFYRFIEKKKANLKLVEQAQAIAAQKKKIEEQKAQLQQRNQETMDSINYASRIQRSSLPSTPLLQNTFSESFVYYKPKDIVSGDFYWMREKIVLATAGMPERRYLYFAVADCTGHGVPGAMMSVLGSSLLNQLIVGPVVKQPADILHELHIQVVVSLNEDIAHRDSQDGMDIALLLIDLNAKRVTYAGAGRPLYYQIGTEELQTIRSDKYSIGDTSDLESVHFMQHEIALEQPTMFYLSTDGVVDQFGGPFAKKFMTKQLKELLHSIAAWPIEKQQVHVQTVLDAWMHGHDQTDDITLVGFRLG